MTVQSVEILGQIIAFRKEPVKKPPSTRFPSLIFSLASRYAGLSTSPAYA